MPWLTTIFIFAVSCSLTISKEFTDSGTFYSNAMRNAEQLLRGRKHFPEDGIFSELESLTEFEELLSRKKAKEYGISISEFVENLETSQHMTNTRRRYARDANEKQNGGGFNIISSLLQNTTIDGLFKGGNMSTAEMTALLRGLMSSLGGGSKSPSVSPLAMQAVLKALQNGNMAQIVPQLMGLLPTVEKMFGNGTNMANVIHALENNQAFADALQAALTSSFYNSTMSMIQSVTTALTNAPAQCRSDLAAMFSAISNGEGWALSMLDALGKPPAGLKYGRTKWIGDYDECMSITANGTDTITGKYCRLSTFVSGVKVLEQPVTLVHGMCVPQSCDKDTLKNLFFPVVLSLSQNFPNNIRLYVYEAKCNERSMPLDGKATALIVICGIFLVLMALGTLYDVYIFTKTCAVKNSEEAKSQVPQVASVEIKYKDLNGEPGMEDPKGMSIQQPAQTAPPKPDVIGKILLSFSIYSNGKRLLNTSQSAGALTSLHGVRFLSMSWVILGHTLALNFNIFDNVGYFAPKWVTWTSFQAVENALVSVDTFFAISGLLVAYLTLKEMKKVKGPLKLNWFMFYFHRFWRLTPAYMMMIAFYTCFTKYYFNGPFYPQDEKTTCTKWWWTNLLYINNLVYDGKAENGCVAWSWYLANDMQFYILSPLLIVPFYLGKGFGFLASFIFLGTTWGATGGLGARYSWPPTTLGGGPDKSHMDIMFTKYYVAPYCRMGPYIVGVVTGYILYHTKCQVKLKWYLNVFLWCVATVLACLVLYGLKDANSGNPLTESESILYLTTHRTVWGACVCWVVFACVTGNGGFINTLLSWEGFVPLSRLTYCAYLVHPIIMEVYQGSMRQPMQITVITMSFLFIGYLVTTMAIAFLFSLAFESPMMALEKVMFSKAKKKDGKSKENGVVITPPPPMASPFTHIGEAEKNEKL